MQLISKQLFRKRLKTFSSQSGNVISFAGTLFLACTFFSAFFFSITARLGNVHSHSRNLSHSFRVLVSDRHQFDVMTNQAIELIVFFLGLMVTFRQYSETPGDNIFHAFRIELHVPLKLCRPVINNSRAVQSELLLYFFWCVPFQIERFCSSNHLVRIRHKIPVIFVLTSFHLFPVRSVTFRNIPLFAAGIFLTIICFRYFSDICTYPKVPEINQMTTFLFLR
ncbi:hypothetical protein BvCmsNSNP023_05161 [Escherichia coli]|nr:hypothetical protein BvCmsNSNP023_05161 [Escherichia coli]GDO64520.1 hypothetical protein BvCmsNSNP019_04163 [Escherichia coli]